jgi:hypothetical protein
MALIKSFSFDVSRRIATAVFTDQAGSDGEALAYVPELTEAAESSFLAAIRQWNGEASRLVFDGTALSAWAAQPSPAHVWSWGQMCWQASSQEIAGCLAAMQADALATIDTTAERARLRYITGGAGQDATYVRKEQQARAWQAAGFAGQAPSFIHAEAEALGINAQTLAEQVLQLADYWSDVKGPQIEATRRKWKVLISAATALADLPALVEAGQAALDAL